LVGEAQRVQEEKMSGDNTSKGGEEPNIVGAAFLWLRNHYEAGPLDGIQKRQVLDRVDPIINGLDLRGADLKAFKEKHPASAPGVYEDAPKRKLMSPAALNRIKQHTEAAWAMGDKSDRQLATDLNMLLQLYKEQVEAPAKRASRLVK
jgi:hypothetical protein